VQTAAGVQQAQSQSSEHDEDQCAAPSARAQAFGRGFAWQDQQGEHTGMIQACTDTLRHNIACALAAPPAHMRLRSM